MGGLMEWHRQMRGKGISEGENALQKLKLVILTTYIIFLNIERSD
jgi:hypothetical protein